MKYRVIRLLTALVMSSVLLTAAGARIQVSSTRVAPGQGVNVKIIAEGEKIDFPELKKIGPYPIENLRRGSKMETRYVQGNFSTKKQQTLSFEFYPRKSVTIPSMEVRIDGKSYRTKATKIEVKKGAAQSAGGFAVRMTVDKKEVYLGEPLVLTVEAVEPLGAGVVQMQYIPPKFDGFFVKPLGGENQIRRGRTTVHQLRYLLIPEQEGEVAILPAQVRVGVRDLNAPADPFGLFGAPMKWTTLRAEPIEIRVKPLPAPADLVGHFTLKADVSSRRVKANQPVNYTLEIVGEGSLEELEDPKFEIPGVTVYSDEAQVESTVKNGALYSRYVKKYVFISDRDFTIPPVKLKVFDYTKQSVQTLQTPSFEIVVTAGGAKKRAVSASPSPGTSGESPAPVSRSATGKTEGNRTENLLEDRAYYAKKAYEEKAAKIPLYLAAAFGAGMVLMWVLERLWRRMGNGWKRRGPAGSRRYKPEEALKILYPHLHDDPEVEEAVRQLYSYKEKGAKASLDREKIDRLAARYDRGE